MTYALLALCALLLLALFWALHSRRSLTLELEGLRAHDAQLAQALEAQREDHAAQLERLAREATKAAARAHLPLAKDLFEPLDNLERARALVPADFGELAQGLDLVHQSFLEALATRDILPVTPDPHGPFDPKLHEAITASSSPHTQTTEIQRTLRTGWTHQTDTLRPAMVSVLKPERAATTAPDTDQEPDQVVEEAEGVVLDFTQEDASAHVEDAEQVVEEGEPATS